MISSNLSLFLFTVRPGNILAAKFLSRFSASIGLHFMDLPFTIRFCPDVLLPQPSVLLLWTRWKIFHSPDPNLLILHFCFLFFPFCLDEARTEQEKIKQREKRVEKRFPLRRCESCTYSSSPPLSYRVLDLYFNTFGNSKIFIIRDCSLTPSLL